MIWYRLNQTDNFSTTEMIVFPLAIGGGISVLILSLNRFFLNQTFKETFNSGESRYTNDILIGAGLTVVYFILFFAERYTLYQWIPNNNGPNLEMINTLIEIAGSPWLLILWFGPVLWIGIALFEELSRVFMLKCLWNISKNKNWEIIVIFMTSTLIGFAHIYQGTAGVISIGIKSVVMCFYFYKYRRILPLIISHALYDGVQFGMFIGQIN